jgi:3-oxoacyl-[acyl-carrier protein] reductase
MQLTHKTVAITGGGRGIGRALAERFGRDGARVALLDVNTADLDVTRSALESAGVVAKSYPVNVAIEAEVVAAMDQIVSDFGSLDVLVNNAGILRDAMLVKVKDGQVVGKMSLAQWQAVIDVNLTGVFLCGREAAERMIRGGSGGVIINISSWHVTVFAPERSRRGEHARRFSHRCDLRCWTSCWLPCRCNGWGSPRKSRPPPLLL